MLLQGLLPSATAWKPQGIMQPGICKDPALGVERACVYLAGDGPGIVPLEALCVDQQPHELSNCDGRVCVVHGEHSLAGELVEVRVLLLEACKGVLCTTQP